MINIPEVKIGLVAVSRDCFPASLAVNRRKALVEAYMKPTRRTLTTRTFMSVLFVSSRARLRLLRLLRMLRRLDVTHFAYILETSVLRFQRHFLLRSLMVL